MLPQREHDRLGRWWRGLLALPFILLGLTLFGLGVEFGCAAWMREGRDSALSLLVCMSNLLTIGLLTSAVGILAAVAWWVARK